MCGMVTPFSTKRARGWFHQKDLEGIRSLQDLGYDARVWLGPEGDVLPSPEPLWYRRLGRREDSDDEM